MKPPAPDTRIRTVSVFRLATRCPVIDLDSLADGDVAASQSVGLWFSNATVRAAGVSLTEFEFPPAKGANVLTDAGGPISIHFDAPIHSFSAHFTCDVPLVLTATGEGGKTVASATSTFSRNLALSVKRRTSGRSAHARQGQRRYPVSRVATGVRSARRPRGAAQAAAVTPQDRRRGRHSCL